MVIRPGGPADVEPAVAVWVAANRARREGVPPRSEQAARGHVDDPEAVLLVELWTQTDNARARRLYERRGFRPSGREKDEFEERIVHYQRDLPEGI